MTYRFWNDYQSIIPYELAIKFDVRLSNVHHLCNAFFSTLLIKPVKENITFYLTGSCIKADSFRDIDFIFPNKEQMNRINECLDKNYFEYENNSHTYKFQDDIFQLVFREKFKDASLHYLVDNFDFDSTKIAFKCVLDGPKKEINILQADIREEFVHYVQTKHNNLHVVNVNPFVSLQRAVHFLKRGDDVPYGVFLDICSKIADLKMESNETHEKFFDRLQGNEEKLQEIKKAISNYVQQRK